MKYKPLLVITILLLGFSTIAHCEPTFKKLSDDFKLCGSFNEKDYLYVKERSNDGRIFYEGQLGRMKISVSVYRETNRITSIHADIRGQNLYHEWRSVLQKLYGSPTKDESHYDQKSPKLDRGYRTAYMTNNIYWKDKSNGYNIQLLAQDSFSDYYANGKLEEEIPEMTSYSAYCEESVYMTPLKTEKKRAKKTR